MAPQSDVDRMVAKLRTQKGISIAYELVEGATHFWNGKLDAVEQKVDHYLDQRMNGLTD